MAVEVQAFRDLDAVAADAAGALDRAAQSRLYDRLDWFRLTATHCAIVGRPLVLRARDDAEAAWLFLAADGRRAQALASWYTLRFGLPARSGGIPAPRLVEALARSLGRSVDRISLEPLDDDTAETFGTSLRASGWYVRATPASASWTVATVPGDWTAYWQDRPSRLRATVARRARAAALEVSILNHFDEAAWQSYEDIYASSWKPAEGAPGFLRALARQEGASGTLRLGLARHEGRAVAAQFWLVENGVATIHKLAHRRDADRLSGGTILSAAMFRHVIEQDRVTRIDFGTGDEPYKADWMDTRRPLHRLEGWNLRSLAGQAGAWRARLAALVRQNDQP